MLKTITLDTPMTFHEALTYMLEGKCLGIRPEKNTNYVEMYKPRWMREGGPDYFLRWNNTEEDCSIRTNQYLERWFPVVVDHRELKKVTQPAQ